MMTDQTENKPKKPTHSVYFVKDKGTEKPEWIKTGVAWEHGDAEGLNLSLTVMGQKVSVTVRKNKPQAE
ncbi:hypothetical protein [Dyadobacter bucti]|uniref:hypothetical protein n=1 Tax=Dyadobacter bucti TaxID=2572203 RepID=UPI0011087F17|nr:hypothetical protein [Dyadobacter bucti]